MGLTEEEILIIIESLNRSIREIENYIPEENFKEYCDYIQSGISYWTTLLIQIKENGTQS